MDMRTHRGTNMYKQGHATGASRATRKKTNELRRCITECFGYIQFTDSNSPNQDWDEALDILRIRLLDEPS